ncbi:hypothetical protein CUJ84_Chr002974 [Rhizobium leguminosarum]|uniref:Uncharacterized protein n=1 Tax=Rhizobium leguminosarum TaxID=384 RepID=A0A2K9Z515_RHILE|nr:hypothetical protein CUJ84_Chr002974 [Rhizobium leguminosarum]
MPRSTKTGERNCRGSTCRWHSWPATIAFGEMLGRLREFTATLQDSVALAASAKVPSFA